jgi:hypothetical protein
MCYEYEWYERERAAEQQRRKQQADQLAKEKEKTSGTPAPRAPERKDKEPLPA